MYGVDAFNAIINPPQAAILAVSRIADRVVPLKWSALKQSFSISGPADADLEPVVRSSRGGWRARARSFYRLLADLIENPMRMLD